ncbi:MAG TPA: ATP-binding protein [Ramlibacter sp.]|uniref:hybrid sensor histidine kinase/response regulator n=1 Tax=Ramlibacter sp. TaxID=1917967 RepID=UPI002ED6B243
MKPQRQGRPLRFRLFLLAASGLLPLAIVAGVVLAYLAGERERDAQDTALAISRAMGAAVDAELRSTIGVLQSIALFDELDPERHRDFHALARRIAVHQGWRAVVLADPAGKVVLSTAASFGNVPASPVEQESMQLVVARMEPVVGTVAEGPHRLGPAFAVRVPVLRGDKLAAVLTAVVPVERIATVLQSQQLPATSVVAVFDQNHNRVSRSREHASARPSPSLQALLNQGRSEGAGHTVTLEGARSQTGYVRLPRSHWVVATGIAQAGSERGLYGVLGAVGGGLLASLALAAFAAWYFARDVFDPIDQLKGAAGALGRGEPVRLEPLGIAELQDVGAALQDASAERDRSAAERESLLARVTEALRRAEDAGRSKDEFLAMLGHELRNPLAPMATALHLMARKGDPGSKTEREVMERQVAHMKRLVDDLLDVSRITGKRLEMRMQPVRAAELVRQAGQSVQSVLGLRRFAVDIAPDAENLWVSGDEVRLSQCLNNLLGNAVKFTGPEGRIALALRLQDAQAGITVSDDGIGMPPEVLEHVFELFYQAPQDADRARGGLGLGLPIVRSLVEMHGGSVQAHSEGEGRGSALTLRLPVIQPPAQAAAAPHAPASDGAQARVLLVDDNQDAADTAGTLLALSGYEVKVAYDPGVALALLDAFEPQVAVLDIGLPGMSGYELAARMQSHRNGRNCYLVALTGYGTAADAVKAYEAGFRRHLVKPAQPEALIEAIEQGLQG